MERSFSKGLFTTSLDGKVQSPPVTANDPDSASFASHVPTRPSEAGTRSVFVFNPFAEGYMAHGEAFAPVSHQAMLAEDLANLPQFLCQPEDAVLVPKQPSGRFLKLLERAGFPPPEFVQLQEGHIGPANPLWGRKLGSLRPWAWGPDSVKLLQPLFAHVTGGPRTANEYFNDDIARLYSKAWSAAFLKKILARCRGSDAACSRRAETQTWLCSEQEAGVAVSTFEDALGAIAAIRSRGHHRVVVKEALGVAGHNAIRLWEPEILTGQRKWLAHALHNDRQLVVEPWLKRELDFSVQLEMGPCGLKLCGFTGLINDLKGQFLANWAEPDHGRCLPAKAAALLNPKADISGALEPLYAEIFWLLEAELQRLRFVGPVSIDAFVYRSPQGDCRLKPVVEINPRYTMGRLTLELMKHARPGTFGLFRLVTRRQARAEGFNDFARYASHLEECLPLRLQGDSPAKISQGALCLNDPAQLRVCLATLQVGPALKVAALANGNDHQRSC